MITVGIETSSQTSSVAVMRADGTVESLEHADRRHVEFVMPAVATVLAKAGLTLTDVEQVVVGLGPGQFTGMRAGIATAKTLAWSLGIPIAGVSSLDLIAAQVPQGTDPFWAAVDARRGQVYAARFVGGARQHDIAIVAVEDLPENELLFGDAPFLEGRITPVMPNAATACRLAQDIDATPVALLEPLYIRRSDAEINWEARGGIIERPDRVRMAKRVSEATGGGA